MTANKQSSPALTFIEQSMHAMEAQLEKMQMLAIAEVNTTERNSPQGRQAREERDRIRNLLMILK